MVSESNLAQCLTLLYIDRPGGEGLAARLEGTGDWPGGEGLAATLGGTGDRPGGEGRGASSYM